MTQGTGLPLARPRVPELAEPRALQVYLLKDPRALGRWGGKRGEFGIVKGVTVALVPGRGVTSPRPGNAVTGRDSPMQKTRVHLALPKREPPAADQKILIESRASGG
jgi:hypothetical protein